MSAGTAERIESPEITSTVDLPCPPSQVADPRRTLAHIKRFAERYRGDASFRARIADSVSLHQAIADLDLRIAPEDALCFIALERGEAVSPTANITAYCKFISDTTRTDRVGGLADQSTYKSYAAWRRRVQGALRFHFSAASDAVVRPVAAYELSRGCSVGCWFCAVGAEKLQAHFEATPENMAVFEATLLAMRSLFGEAAGAAMCYWATDALDNPDYEVFAARFADINGVFPATTTAIAWKDPARSLALLETATSHGTYLNRFSVLSLGMLNRIHASFTAEELLTTDLVFQMPEALVSIGPTASLPAKKIRAGRARTSGRSDQMLYSEEEGTVACVIGFLFNFVDRTIRLIAPCPPTDAHPLGYRVLATAEGFDAASVEKQLSDLVDHHMPIGFGDAPLVLSDSLSDHIGADTLVIGTERHRVAFSIAGVPSDGVRALVSHLRLGKHTASQLVLAMRAYGMNVFFTNLLLHRLREEGVFEIL